MKIFLSGGSGFVGSTLAKALAREGHKLRLLMRKTSSAKNLAGVDYEVAAGDLHNIESLREAVKNVDVIYHVAGQIAACKSEDFFRHNVEGTENLIRVAQSVPHLHRFVYLSSLAAAGPAAEGRAHCEEISPKPVSAYGQSKLAGEEMLRNSGLPSVIVRPPIVYGPYDRGMLSFFKIVNLGIHPALGLGKVDRRYSFIHVDDLVEILVRLGISQRQMSPAELFYAAGEGEYTWDETMRFIAAGLNKKTWKLPIPIAVLKLVGKLNSAFGRIAGVNPPLNHDKIKEIEACYWTCSNRKIKEILDFKPRWDLPQGLSETAKWYATHSWL